MMLECQPIGIPKPGLFVTNSTEVARTMSLTGSRHRVFLPCGQNNADNRQAVGTLRGSYLFYSILPFRVEAVWKRLLLLAEVGVWAVLAILHLLGGDFADFRGVGGCGVAVCS